MPGSNKHTCTSGFAHSKANTKKITPSLINEYGMWLNSLNWCYYCTFTTRHQLSMPAARRSMLRLQSLLTIKNGTPPTIFWVAEPFDTKYGCHLHALVEVTNKNTITKTDLKNAWQVVSKGKGKKEYNNTTIKDYIKSRGAHFYIAKYLQRSGVDYDIFT